MSEYLTTAQAAARLRTKPNTVRLWIRQGRIQAERVGRDYLIQESAVARITIPPGGWKPGRRKAIQ